MVTLFTALWGTSCAIKETQRLPPSRVLPLLEASLDELLGQVRELSESVRSLNARAELIPSTGSAYSGVIEQYRDVRVYVLAQRATPTEKTNAGGYQTHIRVIGQAPVLRKNVFDMVADDHEFRIHIPPKNKFIVGRIALERQSEKPIENLRPQHLLDAIFWAPPATDATHLLEENEIDAERYYVVTELAPAAGAPVLLRKWWFRRTNLALARTQFFGPGGKLISDVHYDVWTQHGDLHYPHWILLARPYDDYRLEFRFDRVDLNPDLDAERFRIEQPKDAELVDLTQPAEKKSPANNPGGVRP